VVVGRVFWRPQGYGGAHRWRNVSRERLGLQHFHEAEVEKNVSGEKHDTFKYSDLLTQTSWYKSSPELNQKLYMGEQDSIGAYPSAYAASVVSKVSLMPTLARLKT